MSDVKTLFCCLTDVFPFDCVTRCLFLQLSLTLDLSIVLCCYCSHVLEISFEYLKNTLILSPFIFFLPSLYTSAIKNLLTSFHVYKSLSSSLSLISPRANQRSCPGDSRLLSLICIYFILFAQQNSFPPPPLHPPQIKIPFTPGPFHRTLYSFTQHFPPVLRHFSQLCPFPFPCHLVLSQS